MNRGLIHKSIRESWGLTAVCGGALMLIQGILSFALPRLQDQLEAQLQALPFLRNIIQAMVGADISGGAGPLVFAAIPWVHPVVLAIVWTHAALLATRLPAGEVDRGTIDLLLGWPVSRFQVLSAQSVVAVVCMGTVVALGLTGNVLGRSMGTSPSGVTPSGLAASVIGLLSLTLAVGALGTLVSALSDRRGKALAVILGTVLASFLLNYLAQFWEPARSLAWLSLLHYHRPFAALAGGAWPWGDWAVLWCAAAALWVAGALVFSRRDLATT